MTATLRLFAVCGALLAASLAIAPSADARFEMTFRRSLPAALDGAVAPDGSIVVGGVFHRPGAGHHDDSVIRKLSADGRHILWSTTLAGSGGDFVDQVAVEPDGTVWVAGVTDSPDFPVLAPFSEPVAALGGPAIQSHIFVVRLSPGGALLSSNVLTQAGQAETVQLALDHSGNLFVVGYVDPRYVPTLPAGAIQSQQGGSYDIFAARINRGGTLGWQTFLGGRAEDRPTAIAISRTGSLVIVGTTFSDDYPTLAPFQSVRAGRADDFVSVISAGGDRLLGSSYFGGDGYEEPRGVAVGGNGKLIISQYSQSHALPGSGSSRRWRYSTVSVSGDAHRLNRVYRAARSGDLLMDGRGRIWLHTESSLWRIAPSGKPTHGRAYLRGLPSSVVAHGRTMLGVGPQYHNHACVIRSCTPYVAKFVDRP
jgi:hypothetical protein